MTLLGMDSEKNGALVPPPVPSPPPVIDEPSPFQFPTKNHNNPNNNSTNNNSEQFQAPPNRNEYRDDRGGPMNRDRDSDRGGPMNRDRDGGWQRRDNGYQPQNRYQPRSNYGPPNHDRQMNYQVKFQTYFRKWETFATKVVINILLILGKPKLSATATISCIATP